MEGRFCGKLESGTGIPFWKEGECCGDKSYIKQLHSSQMLIDVVPCRRVARSLPVSFSFRLRLENPV